MGRNDANFTVSAINYCVIFFVLSFVIYIPKKLSKVWRNCGDLFKLFFFLQKELKADIFLFVFCRIDESRRIKQATYVKKMIK